MDKTMPNPVAPTKIPRNLWLLGICYFLAITVLFTHVSTTSLAAIHILNATKFSTVPIGLFSGVSIIAISPVAYAMNQFGYKTMFLCGAFFGIVGASISTVAFFFDGMMSFGLLSLGMVFQGFAASAVRYYRHLAAVLGQSSQALGAKYIAIVISGGALAGIAGPGLADITVNLISSHKYAAVYISLAAVYAIKFLVLTFIRLPAEPAKTEQSNAAETPPPRALSAIVLQPNYLFAMSVAACAHATMALIMAITPVILKGRVSFLLSSLVIQVHVLAMFLPSFATSKVIGLVGGKLVAVAGQVFCILGFVIYGFNTYWAITAAMVALALGFNFAFVSATALLPGTYAMTEKFKAQAFNDSVVWGVEGILLFLGGFLLHWTGIYAMLTFCVAWNVLQFIGSLTFALLSGRRQRAAVAAATDMPASRPNEGTIDEESAS